jgi:hypothetical protein
MPYFPPSPNGIYIISNNHSDGYITLSDDGYWGATTAHIDSISVSTESENWMLYLCSEADFNTESIRTKLLVSNGLGDSIVPVNETYSSSLASVYLIYRDLVGGALASFYVVGRTL